MSLAVVNPAITDVAAMLTKFDSNLAEFSDPAGCVSFLNLNVPIPTPVVPNPTTLDLTKTLFDLSFSNFKDKILESKFVVKVPIELVVLVSKE